MQLHKSRYKNSTRVIELMDHLLEIHLIGRDKKKYNYVNYGRRCGKSQTISNMVLEVYSKAEVVAKEFIEMPIEQVPLHLNDKEVLRVDAAKWRLKHEPH